MVPWSVLEFLSVTIINCALQSTGLLGLVWIVLCRFPRASAAVRHRVWSLSLLGLLILPAAGLAMPGLRWGGSLAEPVTIASLGSDEFSRRTAPESAPPVPAFQEVSAKNVHISEGTAASIENLPPTDLATDRTPASPMRLWPLIAVVWALGACVSLAAFAVGLWRTNRYVWRAHPLNDEAWRGLVSDVCRRFGLRLKIALREHSQAVAPLICGVWRPRLVLPEIARDWDADMRSVVLLHELSHVQRHDIGWQLIGRLACALYWFHPLPWYALRRMRVDRELACDDAAVLAGERASRYAESLLRIARSCVHPRGLPFAVAMAETGQLELRVSSLFDESRSHAPVSRPRGWLLAGVAGLAIAMIAVIEPFVLAEEAPNEAKTAIESRADANAAESQVDAGAAAEAIRTVRGRVIDEQKQPLANADVALVVYPEMENYLSEGGRVIAEAETDAAGGYLLHVPARELRQRQVADIWARKTGFTAVRHNWHRLLSELGRQDEPPLALAQTDGTTIRVTDPDGLPRADVRVIPRGLVVPRGVPYALPKEWLNDSTATTDGQGMAELKFVHPESLSEMELHPAGDAGFVRFDGNFFLNVRPQKAAPHFSAKMPATGSLSGRLVAADGCSLPDHLKLKLISFTEWHRGEPVGRQGVVEVSVGPDGSFAAPQLASGIVFVPKFLPDDQPLRAEVPADIIVKPGETTAVAIPIAPGVLLRGRFRKHDTRQPAKDYRLTLIYGQSISVRRADFPWLKYDLQTDAEGWFECRVPPGPVELRLGSYLDGYRAATHWLPREARGRWGMLIEVPRKASYDLVPIDLYRNIPVKGQLVDLERKPLEDWSIYGYPRVAGLSEFETMNSVPGVHTDDVGRFESSYPEPYPPARWKASFRRWKTKYEFEDDEFEVKVISKEPLVLQVDPAKPAEE